MCADYTNSFTLYTMHFGWGNSYHSEICIRRIHTTKIPLYFAQRGTFTYLFNIPLSNSANADMDMAETVGMDVVNLVARALVVS